MPTALEPAPIPQAKIRQRFSARELKYLREYVSRVHDMTLSLQNDKRLDADTRGDLHSAASYCHASARLLGFRLLPYGAASRNDPGRPKVFKSSIWLCAHIVVFCFRGFKSEHNVALEKALTAAVESHVQPLLIKNHSSGHIEYYHEIPGKSRRERIDGYWHINREDLNDTADDE